MEQAREATEWQKTATNDYSNANDDNDGDDDDGVYT